MVSPLGSDGKVCEFWDWSRDQEPEEESWLGEAKCDTEL